MKSVLVTLANRNYLDAARQLFASAHFAGGWQGNYLLLTHDVPAELTRDFRDRGIIVHEARPLTGSELPDRTAVAIAKLRLFEPFFKQWDRVLYLDGDMIVRGRLGSPLYDVKFGAVRDLLGMRSQYRPGKGPEDLRNSRAFNSGLLSFDTSVIEDETHAKITALFLQYWRETRLIDQPHLNYYFRDMWTALPLDYNVFAQVSIFGKKWQDGKHGSIIHFTNKPKPWAPECPSQAEWKENLRSFGDLDITKRNPGRQWTKSEMCHNAILQQFRFRLARLDCMIGEGAAAIRDGLGRTYHA